MGSASERGFRVYHSETLRVPGTVPEIRMFRRGCGYTNVAMAIQWAGFPDVKPSDVFTEAHVDDQGNHLKFDSKKENDPSTLVRTPRVGFGDLAIATIALTKDATGKQRRLVPKIWDEEEYDKVKKLVPRVTPHHILRRYLREGIPCMIRLDGHSVLVTGKRTVEEFGIRHEQYIFNNPSEGKEQTRPVRYTPGAGYDLEDNIEHEWSKEEYDDNGIPNYPGYSTVHLMMAFVPFPPAPKTPIAA